MRARAASGPRTFAVTAAAAVAVNAAAGVTLAFAWYRSAQLVRVSEQLVWLATAIVALIVVIVGDTGVVIAGRAALRRRAGRLQQLVAQPAAAVTSVEAVQPAQLRALAAGAVPTPAPEAALPSLVVVDVPGVERFHRSDCALVRDKPVRAAATVETPLQPCGVCRP